MWSSSHRFVATLLVPLCFSACGFQARGVVEYPQDMSVVYIDARDRYSTFYRTLVTAVRESELRLTNDPTAADTVIRILGDETGQRVVSVSARNVPQEYNVYYTIQYAVDRNGAEVLAPQELTRTRDYTYDETQVLGKAIEEEILRESLAADLVGLIQRRIGSLR